MSFALFLCWLLGHEPVILSGRMHWACRRCRQVWPLLALALALAGCHPTPPTPLLPLYDRSNALAQQLDDARAAHEERLRQDMRARLGQCPAGDPEAHRRCGMLAAQAALDAAAQDRLRLVYLTNRHSAAREALESATRCRAQGDESCVAQRRDEAAVELARVEAGLREGKE